MIPTLIPIEAVNPSAYNPRETDPRRLALIELSLRKLGFLLPLYADANGELLSGHQRQLAARRVGFDRVPVCRTAAMPLPKRKAVNIVFNRGTNDLDCTDTPTNLTEAIERSNVEALATALPDVTGDERYPCMSTRDVPIRDLLRANSGRWNRYAKGVSKTLRAAGIQMPLVCTPDLRVVNGIGRLEMLAESKATSAPVVFVSSERAAFADVMLNLLSMDFTLHLRYTDLLRYNSFRRARRTRDGLGRGFIFRVNGGKAANEYDVTIPANATRWKATYGTSVVDFGAGHLTETKILRSIGVAVSAFEPFRLGAGNDVDKAASIDLTLQFLADVSAGRRFDSIFISSVLNSVPFVADRQAIATICAALCDPGTRLYALASATGQSDWKEVNGKEYVNEKLNISFALGYEPGIKVGDFGDKPKVQKYHTPGEFHALFAERFEDVKVGFDCGDKNVWAIASKPRPVDTVALRAALVFEFDLPYPDGSRMGLAEAAIAAFSKRLRLDLNATDHPPRPQLHAGREQRPEAQPVQSSSRRRAVSPVAR